MYTPAQRTMMQFIAAKAHNAGVPPELALAFAWLESRFDPAAKGDALWAEKYPDRYKRFVLENPALSANPYKHDRALWHSYGLFQLLAPHFVHGSEHPHLLYNIDVNTDRALTFIKRLLRENGGDFVATRLAYAGASKASADTQQLLESRVRSALHRFEGVA